jgi:hypothetical protein
VVGNRDDVKASYQAVIDPEVENDVCRIHVEVQTNSAAVQNAVKRGKAIHVLHVECSNTLYRNKFAFKQPKKTISISANDLCSRVECNVVTIASEDISGYKPANAHEDYGDAKFKVRKGEILAISEGYAFDAEIDLDSLKRVKSIVQIRASDEEEGPMKINLNPNRILVELSKKDIKNYEAIKAIPQLATSIVPSVVMPALILALEELKKTKQDDEESQYSTCRWFSLLPKRIEHSQLSLDTDSVILAQQLLKNPIEAAFGAAAGLSGQVFNKVEE